jgi:hypothetical protein
MNYITTEILSRSEKPPSVYYQADIKMSGTFDFGPAPKIILATLENDVLKKSKFVNLLPNSTEIKFFDNVILPNFFNLKTRRIHAHRVIEFCSKEPNKAQTYLDFLKRHMSKVSKIMVFEKTVHLVVEPLIVTFEEELC